MSELHFPSKRDFPYAAILIGSAGVGLDIVVSILSRHQPAVLQLLLPPTLVLSLGLPLWVLVDTGYTLTPTELRIRSGPFRWLIPISSIRSIVPSRDTRSSPALSLDRLRITYGPGKAVLISPVEPVSFLHELRRRRGQNSPPL